MVIRTRGGGWHTTRVLAVVGERSLVYDPICRERHQMLLDWLPQVEPFVLPGATHLLQIENPAGWRRVWRAFLPVMAASLRSEYRRAVSRG